MDSSSPYRHLSAKLVSDTTSKWKGEVTMKLSRVGVDLAKNVYQLHGVDRHGKTVWKRRLRCGQWLQALLDKVEPGCEIGMEACTGAHHWARELQSRGYTVRLIAPQFVKPYVKSNKNDAEGTDNLFIQAVRTAWNDLIKML
jgi:transposase